MFRVVNKQILGKDVRRLDVIAWDVAKKFQPGQFVMVKVEEHGEKIPLEIIEADLYRGSIALIFQEKGPATEKLGQLQINDAIFSILGPLGQPAVIEKIGIVVCVAHGVDVAPLLPICRGFKRLGNKTLGIIGADTKKELILEAQMRVACHKILITTEDGSYIRKGTVLSALRETIDQEKVNLVYCIGDIDLMQDVSELTKQKKIKTVVHLNPVMIDGIGVCGSCRVKVGGQTLLACVDGPEFDAHQVDFKDLKIRMKTLKESGKCCEKTSTSSQKTKGSKTLERFLSAVLKK
ncbi:MAG: sulfide/dihydroorotate dehydrogenase-like FAD/NAD-binding protein [Candidatus Omnitrophota bacterium]